MARVARDVSIGVVSSLVAAGLLAAMPFARDRLDRMLAFQAANNTLPPWVSLLLYVVSLAFFFFYALLFTGAVFVDARNSSMASKLVGGVLALGAWLCVHWFASFLYRAFIFVPEST